MHFYSSLAQRPQTEASKRLRTLAVRMLMLIQTLLAPAPILMISIIVVAAWRASLHLGYWPNLDAPDLSTFKAVDPLFILLDTLFGITFLITYYSIVLFPLVTLILIRRTPVWHTIGLWVIYGTGWMSLFVPFIRDVMRWYI